MKEIQIVPQTAIELIPIQFQPNHMTRLSDGTTCVFQEDLHDGM